ncbi:hypothetical protein ACFQ88_39060 [Paenibacillus sp. NPDC056579]|uniref:hypothetical protein n=1 Tax=Paenibacillus sp. NPDC056579 TaxID=3345871 RepID=UPI0036BE2D30
MSRSLQVWSTVMIAAIFLLAGCFDRIHNSNEVTPTAPSPPAPVIPKDSEGKPAITEPSPSPSAAAKPVHIVLEDEPRLPSQATALVSKTPKKWVLSFGESMNRASVEEVMKRNLVPAGSQDLSVDITFQWENDRMLKVTTTPKPAESSENPNARLVYSLSVNGAQTAAGNKLEKADEFRAVISDVEQIYRYSLDGKIKEKLSSFDKPYMLRSVMDPGYIAAVQFAQYCECDAPSSKLYDLFSLKDRTFVSYPVELYDSYTGEGNFDVDSRGFFYSNPKGLPIPQSASVNNITIDGMIFGTGISKDRRHVFIAKGTKDQKTDFDLAIINLDNGKQDVFEKAMKGYPPANQVSSRDTPIVFRDDGKLVIFTMENREPWGYVNYAFDWGSRTVTPWKSPTGVDDWSGANMSSDGVYQLNGDGHIYKNGVKQNGPKPIMHGIWVNGTHSMILFENKGNNTKELLLYDADSGKMALTNISLRHDQYVIGSSEDGKWLYVTDKQ